MADSPNTPTLPEIHPSRRSALAGIAGTLALATGAVTAVAVRSAHADENSDAELIALCGEFIAAWRTWEQMAEQDAPTEEFEAYHADPVQRLYSQLVLVRPQTLPGAIAKARAALVYEYDYPEDDGTNQMEEQGKWFVQELAGLEAVS